jgi:nitroreductase
MSSHLSFKELMKQRYSCRNFLSKPIPEDILKDIIETSLLTPSWGNSQPWNIYVSSGKNLESIRKEWIEKNSKGIKGYSDIEAGHRSQFSERSQNIMNDVMDKLSEILKDKECKLLWEANNVLFNAPTVVYITIPKKRTQYCLFDSGAIEMAIMIAAKEHGIDSVPAYQAIKYPDILRKYLKVPDDEDIVFGIALGYEDKENILNKYKSKKLSLEEACHFYN